MHLGRHRIVPTLNARPASQVKDWLDEITESLAIHEARNAEAPAAAYAVNLIVHRTNERLEQDLAAVVAHRVPVVVTSLGARADVNEAVHSCGGIVLHDVIDDGFARKAVEKGADGLVAVAAGAGGHAGAQSPFALVQEIRRWFDGPLLLSGAIASGRAVLAARALGADLAYIGSAFIATPEARAVDTYKQMVIDSSASDIVNTARFTGVRANYLRGSILTAGLDPDDLGGPGSRVEFGERAGPKAWSDIWGAGQGIGAVLEERPTRVLVDRWVEEYDAARLEVTATR